jgi:hypothetical protein
MAAGTGPQEQAGRASQTFDVFLSYNRADQSAVEEIAHAPDALRALENAVKGIPPGVRDTA